MASSGCARAPRPRYLPQFLRHGAALLLRGERVALLEQRAQVPERGGVAALLLRGLLDDGAGLEVVEHALDELDARAPEGRARPP